MLDKLGIPLKDGIFQFNEYWIEKKNNYQKPLLFKINKYGCWNCISHKANGNPIRVSRNNKQERVYRYIYKNVISEIPDNKLIMHLCDNELCLNPKHYKVGTHQDNMDDMVRKNRQGKTCEPGENNGNSRLTEEIVWKIFNSKKTQAKIAIEFGISQALVSKIKTKKIWRYLHE